MKLEYYHSERHQAFLQDSANIGLDGVAQLLDRIREEKIAQVEIFDTSSYSREKLYDIYLTAAMAAVRNKYAVRQVFGSRSKSGALFGREVPALLIYEVGDSPFPDHLYPHEENRRMITIADRLHALVKERRTRRKH